MNDLSVMLDTKTWPENLASSCHIVRGFAIIFRELMVRESGIEKWGWQVSIVGRDSQVSVYETKGWIRCEINDFPENQSCRTADMLYAVPLIALKGQRHKVLTGFQKRPTINHQMKQIFSCFGVSAFYILSLFPFFTPSLRCQLEYFDWKQTHKQLHFVTFDIVGPEGWRWICKEYVQLKPFGMLGGKRSESWTWQIHFECLESEWRKQWSIAFMQPLCSVYIFKVWDSSHYQYPSGRYNCLFFCLIRSWLKLLMLMHQYVSLRFYPS